MGRALFVLAVAPMAALTPAHAQTGGIQVAPVMVEMSQERNFASLRLAGSPATEVLEQGGEHIICGVGQRMPSNHRMQDGDDSPTSTITAQV
jgi:hypothetical protein